PWVGERDRCAGQAVVRSRGPRSCRRAGRGGGASRDPSSHQRADGGEDVSTLIERATGTSSAEVRALRDRYVPKGLHVGTPVVVARANGAEVWDPEGKRYRDGQDEELADGLHAHDDAEHRPPAVPVSVPAARGHGRGGTRGSARTAVRAGARDESRARAR